MPSFLGGGAGLKESGGTAESVGGGGFVTMVGGFPVAGEGGVMLWVF